MFREMRRKKQLLEKQQTEEILYSGTAGVLALAGDGGYPYAVPISYVYDGEKLYFHGAKSGHKIDAIKNNPKASFCVIAEDNIVPEEYTTYFKSAIAFGKIHIIENAQEIMQAAEKLALKYHPADTKDGRHAAIERELTPLCMLEMTIEHLTGKEAIELVKKR